MRNYLNTITLDRGTRGVYCLDTTKGCSSGMDETPGGCYHDCYAAKSAKLHGHNFHKTVSRRFQNELHKQTIVRQISRIKLDFVRIGCSGDPSEDWWHTLSVLRDIKYCNKEIVIVTRHWQLLTDEQLLELSGMNVCFNTSVSALDSKEMREKCLGQYERIKSFCKSILRVISCDFNLENKAGHKLAKIQQRLFENEDTLDTVLRVNKRNPFVKDGIIKVTSDIFLGKSTLVSKFNQKTFFGKCDGCREMCGVKITNSLRKYTNGPRLIRQPALF